MIKYLINGEQFLAASGLDVETFIEGKLDITNLSLGQKNDLEAALISNSGKQVTVYSRNGETNEKIKSLLNQISPKVSPSVSPADSISSGKRTPNLNLSPDDQDLESQKSKPINKRRPTLNSLGGSIRGIASSFLGWLPKNDEPIENQWIEPDDRQSESHIIEAVVEKITQCEDTDAVVLISGPNDRVINHAANVKRQKREPNLEIENIPGGIHTLQLLTGTIKDLEDENILSGADAYMAHNELIKFLTDPVAVSDRATKCHKINFSEKSVRKSMQEVSADLRPLFFHQQIKTLNIKPYIIDADHLDGELTQEHIKQLRDCLYRDGKITDDAPLVIITSRSQLINEIKANQSRDALDKCYLIKTNIENLAEKARSEIQKQLAGDNLLILDSAIIFSNSNQFYAKFLETSFFQSKMSQVKIGFNITEINHTGYVHFNSMTDFVGALREGVAAISERRENDNSVLASTRRMIAGDFERLPKFPYTSAAHEFIKNRSLEKHREVFGALTTQLTNLQNDIEEINVHGRIIETMMSSQVTEERKSELKIALRQQVSFEKGLLVAYAVNLAPSLIKMIDPTQRAAISGSDSFGALVKVIPNYLNYGNTIEKIDRDYSQRLSAHFTKCLAYAITQDHTNPSLGAYTDTLRYAKMTMDAQNKILDTYKFSERRALTANALLGAVGVAGAAYGIYYGGQNNPDVDLKRGDTSMEAALQSPTSTTPTPTPTPTSTIISNTTTPTPAPTTISTTSTPTTAPTTISNITTTISTTTSTPTSAPTTISSITTPNGQSGSESLVGDRIAIGANGLVRAGNFFTAHSFIMDGIIRRNGMAFAHNIANQLLAGFEKRLDDLNLKMSASIDKDLNQETTGDSEVKQTASNSNSTLPLPGPSTSEEEPNLKILAKPRYALLDLSNDGHFYPNKSSAELKEQIALDLALIRENITNYNHRYQDGDQAPNLDRHIVITDNEDIKRLVNEINKELDHPIQLFSDRNEAMKELPLERYSSLIAFSNNKDIINDMARRQFATSVASSDKAKMADLYLESVSQLRTTAARNQSSGWMSSIYDAMMNYLVMTRSWGKLPENGIHKAILDRKIRNGMELLAEILPEKQLNLVDQGIHNFFGIASFHEKVIKAGHNLSADGLKKNVDREIYYNLARFLQMWVRPALVAASTANLVWVDANQVSAIIQAVTSYPILRATTIQKQETWNWKKADVLSGYESSARQSILDKNWNISAAAVKNLALYRSLLEMDQMQIYLDGEEQKLRQIEDRLLNTALASGIVGIMALGLVFTEGINQRVFGRLLGGASFLSTALAGGVAALQVYQYYEAVDSYKQLLDTVAQNAKDYRPNVEEQHLRGVIEQGISNVLTELEKVTSLEAMDEKKRSKMKMMVAEIIPEYLGLSSNEEAMQSMDKLKALNSRFTSTTKEYLQPLLWQTRLENKNGIYFPLTEQTRIVQEGQRSLAGAENRKRDHIVVDMSTLDADEQQNQGVGSSSSSSSAANHQSSDEQKNRTEYYVIATNHHPGKAKGGQTKEDRQEIIIDASEVDYYRKHGIVRERQVPIEPTLSPDEAKNAEELIENADRIIDTKKSLNSANEKSKKRSKKRSEKMVEMGTALNRENEQQIPSRKVATSQHIDVRKKAARKLKRIYEVEKDVGLDPLKHAKILHSKKVSRKADALNLEPSKTGNTPVSRKGKSVEKNRPRRHTI